MWLLDVNLPSGLVPVLQAHGFACDTTARRGWRELTNGALAEAAAGAGFRVILTRDRLFGKTAGPILSALPELAVVIVTLPQAREAGYLAAFDTQWRQRPIEPIPGAIIEWPASRAP
jgi:Domain of unknown function (DUF5615)